MALGLGTLGALRKGGPLRPWLLGATLADVTDLVATVRNRSAIPARRAASMLALLAGRRDRRAARRRAHAGLAAASRGPSAMEDTLFTTLLLPAALAVIMFGLGMELTPADFRRVLTVPRGVAIGMLNLALISPAIAFGAAELFALGPALAVGLVLLGASPGGTMANMLTHLARGDTALSVTMTAISSIAAIVTVPLALELAQRALRRRPLRRRSRCAASSPASSLITIVPVAVGMAVRRRWPAWVRERATAHRARGARTVRARRGRRGRSASTTACSTTSPRSPGRRSRSTSPR